MHIACELETVIPYQITNAGRSWCLETRHNEVGLLDSQLSPLQRTPRYPFATVIPVHFSVRLRLLLPQLSLLLSVFVSVRHVSCQSLLFDFQQDCRTEHD